MKHAAIFVAISAFSTAVVADQAFSFRYIEAAHYDQESQADYHLSNNIVESTSNSLAISYEIDGALFQASYGKGETDKVWGYKADNLDYEKASVFVGGVGSPSAKTSVFGGFGFQHEKFETPFANFDAADTYAASFGGGVRYWLLPMVEINGGANFLFADYEHERETDVEASVGLRFQPIKWLSLGASYSRQFDAKAEILKADIRFQL